ncbi:SulP family inorganic anion transporter [Clostridium thailandense]|uniref:SulP family inorganic anion transporter n=1 Tax=Clostridium thailandense TaxID=2794346 RepID=UPI003989DF9D
MKLNLLFKKSPILSGILPINKTSITTEMFAGITLAAIAIPEVMGYTKISGTPIITGIYTMLLPIIIFAIFGASRHMVIGADSATAAILAQGLIPLAAIGSQQYMEYTELLAIMVGIMLLLCRLLRVGFISKFLSRTVLVGFLTGVGIQVAVGQMGEMFGVSVSSKNVIEQMFKIILSLPHANLLDFLMTLIVLFFIFIPKIFANKKPILRKIPWSLIALISTIILCYALNLPAKGLSSVGLIPHGLPHFSIPSISVNRITQLFPTAAIIVLVIITQSAATSSVYADQYGESFNINADLIGLSLANITAGLSGTFVVNGSPTKTQIVDESGGRSQLTHVFSAIVVIFVLLFLTDTLYYLPNATLSAIVFTIGLHLINVKSLKKIYKQKRIEFFVAVLTAIVVVIFGVAQGIIIAMLLSLINYLRRSYSPKNSLIIPSSTKDGDYIWACHPVTYISELTSSYVVYHFAASLYYANVSSFTQEVEQLFNAPHHPEYLFIDFAAIADVDFTGGEVLLELSKKIKSKNIDLGFVHVDNNVMLELQKYGVLEIVKNENVLLDMKTIMGMFKSSIDKTIN